MGNNTSIFSQGAAIVVTVEKAQYQAGEVVKGRIYLNVVKESVSCNEIFIKLVGVENTSVEYTTTSGTGKNRKTTHHTAHETHTIFTADSALHSYTGGLVKKGNYEYPFELSLPPTLPGTVNGAAPSAKYSINYTLEARLQRHGTLTWDVTNKIYLYIVDKQVVVPLTPKYVEPSLKKINFLCCISSGTMGLGSKVNTTSAYSGDNIVVTYDVGNYSTSRIKAMQVSIVQSSFVTAQGHSDRSYTTLSSTRIEACELTNVTPKNDGQVYDFERIRNEMAASLMNDTNLMNITIPEGTKHSYDGCLFHIRHSMHIKICTPFCVDDPEIAIPLKLLGQKHENLIDGASNSFILEMPNNLENDSYVKPADWDSEVSATVMLYAAPVKDDSSKQDVSSIDGLLDQMNKCGKQSRVNTVAEWVTYGDISSLTPQNIHRIYQCISVQSDFADISSILCDRMINVVTVEHVYQAAIACKEGAEVKYAICSNFARNCVDKANAGDKLTKLGLSDFFLHLLKKEYGLV